MEERLYVYGAGVTYGAIYNLHNPDPSTRGLGQVIILFLRVTLKPPLKDTRSMFGVSAEGAPEFSVRSRTTLELSLQPTPTILPEEMTA